MVNKPILYMPNELVSESDRKLSDAVRQCSEQQGFEYTTWRCNDVDSAVFQQFGAGLGRYGLRSAGEVKAFYGR